MLTTRCAVTVTAALLLILTGCSDDDEEGGDQQVTSNQDSVPRATPEAEEKAPEELLESVRATILSADDIGHDVEEQDRDDSLGTVTNDICAREWPSNDERVAREQALYWEGGDVAQLVVSNEVVAYNEGEAAKALAEIENAIDECGDWKHRQGEITGVAEANVPEGAGPDAFAWEAVDERDAGEPTYSYFAVYQVHGDMLSALYLWAPTTDDVLEVAGELTPQVAERLQKSDGG